MLAVDRPGSNLTFDNGLIETFGVDLATPEAPAAIVGKAIADFGRLDILYNNAGVASNALAANMTDEQWPVRCVTQSSERPIASASVTKVALRSCARIGIRLPLRSNSFGRSTPAACRA